MTHERSHAPVPQQEIKEVAPEEAPAEKIATPTPQSAAAAASDDTPPEASKPEPEPESKPEPEPIIGRRFGAQPLKTVYQNMISPETAAARRIHQMNLATSNRPNGSTSAPARNDAAADRTLHISVTGPQRALSTPEPRPHQVHPFLGHRSTTLLNPAAALHRYQRDRLSSSSQPKAPDIPEDSEKTP